LEKELTLAEAAEQVRTAKADVLEAQSATTKAQKEKRERETELVIAKSGLERAERKLIETALKSEA
jgi:hypothetical protein